MLPSNNLKVLSVVWKQASYCMPLWNLSLSHGHIPVERKDIWKFVSCSVWLH